MNRKRWIMAAGGTLVAAAMAVGVAGTAFADNSATPTSGSQPRQSGQTNRGEDFLNKLAQNLGISTDQLQTGLKTTEKGYVDQAQQNGKISSAQASNLNQKIDQGNGLGILGRIVGRFHKGQAVQQQVGKAVANAIGITPAQLKSEVQSGKTVQQVITEHGKTVDDVVNAVVSQAQTRLDAAVKNGKITTDQESTRLNNLKQKLTDAINNNQLPKGGQNQTATPSA